MIFGISEIGVIFIKIQTHTYIYKYYIMKLLSEKFISDCKESIKLEFSLPRGFYLSYEGVCPICENNVIFSAKDTWLRDSLICDKCKSIPRERALMLQIKRSYPKWKKLIIHESSPGKRGVSAILRERCCGYTSTHYFPLSQKGSIVNGFRNENLEDQTFNDEGFDLVITQDVMEHVYNPEKAFSEIARTLKPGGAHIFTVPLVNKHKPTQVWATRGADNRPVFNFEPEYHGNPVDPDGSPVTMHWGYDIVNFIRESCGMETSIEYMYNLEYGIWAELNEVVISRKM